MCKELYSLLSPYCEQSDVLLTCGATVKCSDRHLRAQGCSDRRYGRLPSLLRTADGGGGGVLPPLLALLSGEAAAPPRA